MLHHLPQSIVHTEQCWCKKLTELSMSSAPFQNSSIMPSWNTHMVSKNFWQHMKPTDSSATCSMVVKFSFDVITIASPMLRPGTQTSASYGRALPLGRTMMQPLNILLERWIHEQMDWVVLNLPMNYHSKSLEGSMQAMISTQMTTMTSHSPWA